MTDRYVSIKPAARKSCQILRPVIYIRWPLYSTSCHGDTNHDQWHLMCNSITNFQVQVIMLVSSSDSCGQGGDLLIFGQDVRERPCRSNAVRVNLLVASRVVLFNVLKLCSLAECWDVLRRHISSALDHRWISYRFDRPNVLCCILRQDEARKKYSQLTQ